ncbi:MAG: hypothetical protein J0626_07505 [Rhodospirillaceae bacterium]|nr:hypothetical protein [Rhodospirillaceae bacterium]
MQVGQHRAVARFHVLRQQRGQPGLFPPQRAEAKKQEKRRDDEGDKADEETDFKSLHGVDFTRQDMKKPGTRPGFQRCSA